jgi:hypothetical protein
LAGLDRADSDNPFHGGTRFCDLADGRFLACVFLGGEFHVVLGSADGKLPPRDQTPVIARGVVSFLERVLASGGDYWFDEPGFEAERLPCERE